MRKTRKRHVAIITAALFLPLPLGCDSGGPSAPSTGSGGAGAAAAPAAPAAPPKAVGPMTKSGRRLAPKGTSGVAPSGADD
jgi:hypothetical protein